MKTIETYYITSSRTIEVLIHEDKAFFIYNYEGNHFRLFDSILELIRFFDGDPNKDEASFIGFDSEEELDNYLKSL